MNSLPILLPKYIADSYMRSSSASSDNHLVKISQQLPVLKVVDFLLEIINFYILKNACLLISKGKSQLLNSLRNIFSFLRILCKSKIGFMV